MEENPKEIMEARDAHKEAVFRLMDLSPGSGWQMALQDIYDARWEYEQRLRDRKAG